MFPQIQSQLPNYNKTVGKNFQIGKRKMYIIGCGSFWISSTLSQQVVPMVLHVEVYLIPPRGLPTIGPPKSCRPTQRLTLHSFFCKFCVPQNDCQVCVIRSTTMSVAPEMTDWNASLNWSDWSVRWPSLITAIRVVESLTLPLSLLKISDFHLGGNLSHCQHTPTRLKSETKSNKTRHMQASWWSLRARSVLLHCSSTGESFVPYCLSFPLTMLHLICQARKVTAYLIDRALTPRNIQITWGPAGVGGLHGEVQKMRTAEEAKEKNSRVPFFIIP